MANKWPVAIQMYGPLMRHAARSLHGVSVCVCVRVFERLQEVLEGVHFLMECDMPDDFRAAT